MAPIRRAEMTAAGPLAPGPQGSVKFPGKERPGKGSSGADGAGPEGAKHTAPTAPDRADSRQALPGSGFTNPNVNLTLSRQPMPLPVDSTARWNACRRPLWRFVDEWPVVLG